LVLRGTELQKMYESGTYQPLSMEEALYWSRRAYESFMAAGIAVLQIGLHSSEFCQRNWWQVLTAVTLENWLGCDVNGPFRWF